MPTNDIYFSFIILFVAKNESIGVFFIRHYLPLGIFSKAFWLPPEFYAFMNV